MPPGCFCYMQPRRSNSALPRCGRGGIGRRAALRSLWGNPWKFESSRPHQVLQEKPAFAGFFFLNCPTSYPCLGHISSPHCSKGKLSALNSASVDLTRFLFGMTQDGRDLRHPRTSARTLPRAAPSARLNGCFQFRRGRLCDPQCEDG